MLHFEINNQYKALIEPQATVTALLERLEQSGRFPIGSGELSIALVDDATIAQVHADFLQDPTPTDVITFPSDPAMEAAGEIIVSVDHARERAAELALPFDRELTLYLVHGWLHLAGFDDRTEADRAAMRAAEEEALKILGAGEPVPPFRLSVD